MAYKEPKELLRILNKHIDTINNNTSLSGKERKNMAAELVEVSNYLSSCIQGPSSVNLLYINSAKKEERKIQTEKEHKILDEHKQFVQDSFNKAEQYFRAIQLGGYAVFFALWSITEKWLNQIWIAIAVLLMLISATIFVTWEVYKSVLLAFSLKRHAALSQGKLEVFVQSRMGNLSKEKDAINSLTKCRALIWLLSVITAVPAIIIFMFQLLDIISKKIFS